MPPSTVPSFRLQICPDDPRRRSWQLLLGRRAARLLGLLALLVVVPSLVGWAVFPKWLRGHLARHRVDAQAARRLQLGDRLQGQVAQIEELAGQLEGLAKRVEKARRLVGLESDPRGEPRTEGNAASPSIYAGLEARGWRLEREATASLAWIGRTIERLEAAGRQRPVEVAAVPSVSPLGGAESVLVAGFGTRRNPYTQQLDLHAGIDVAAPHGTPVLAAGGGRVVFAGVFDRRKGGWWRFGNVVAIRHGERFLTLYGHLDQMLVRPGAEVRRGEPVGSVGNSGWATTTHLHYEVRRREGGGWRPVDPRLHLLDRSWDDESGLLEPAATPLSGWEPLPAPLD